MMFPRKRYLYYLRDNCPIRIYLALTIVILTLLITIYLDRLRFTGSFERQRDTKHLKICRESKKDLHEAYYSDGKITCFEQELKEILFHLFSFL